jgi:formimidoylglutamate deiminase
VPRLHFRSALLPTGWAEDVRIEVQAGRIAKVEPGVAATAEDERDGIALPGMPNLHSHAFQRAMAGLTEQRGDSQDSFWTWRTLMYRFAARITPEDLQAIAAQAFIEMLEAGFTRVGEFHYVHHDVEGRPFSNPAEMGARIAAAAADTGIALTLLPVFYAHGGFGGQAPHAGQTRFLTDIDRYAALLEASRAAVAALPDAVVGVAPHSLRAVTPQELPDIVALSTGAPVHIHIAEQEQEVRDCIAWSGMRPVQWLLDGAAVDPSWCLVHATHVTSDELAGIARSGAVVGLCPITEANLGDGLFPAADFQQAGGSFGIGSDSNVRIDLNEELRLLEYGQRLRDRSRNVMASAAGVSTGRALFDAALRGGSQALGAPHAGLAPGAAADFVTLDASSNAFVGRSGDALLDTFVFAGDRQLIRSVWRAGERVVTNGVHRGRVAIAESYTRVLKRLLAA